ncbi:MAG: hypothetical protein HQM03_12680 [Magnetococcales bacterium]|nr:hypothetical protein [Magnetococcales bacterium]
MSIHDATLTSLFPNLTQAGAFITSMSSPRYNCIAWAAEDQEFWWEPASPYYWPSRAKRENSLNGWISAFQTLHYQPCATGSLDPAYSKIAIYVKEGTPTHVARQLSNGKWTSKCGKLQDIEHDLADLAGVEYGQPFIFMQKLRQVTP